MDMRTKWVLIGGAAAAVLVAVSALPPDVCDERPRSIPEAAMCAQQWFGRHTHASLVNGVRARLAAELAHRTIADSLSRATGARRLVSGALTVHYERQLSADSARRYLALAEQELASIPGTGSGMRVVLVLQSDPERFRRRTLPDGRRSPFRTVFERFAIGGGDGTCFVLVDIEGRGADPLLQQGRPALLDWCAVLARYGPPGRDVRRWSHIAFTPGWRSALSLAEQLPTARGESRRQLGAYEARACVAGAFAACLDVLGLRRGFASRFEGREVTQDFLAWLLATGEPGQFERFWRSDEAVPAALAAAYGRPAGETAVMWARQRLGKAERGPTSAPGLVLAGAVWFSLALVAAFVAIQRREVG